MVRIVKKYKISATPTPEPTLDINVVKKTVKSTPYPSGFFPFMACWSMGMRAQLQVAAAFKRINCDVTVISIDPLHTEKTLDNVRIFCTTDEFFQKCFLFANSRMDAITEKHNCKNIQTDKQGRFYLGTNAPLFSVVFKSPKTTAESLKKDLSQYLDSHKKRDYSVYFAKNKNVPDSYDFVLSCEPKNSKDFFRRYQDIVTIHDSINRIIEKSPAFKHSCEFEFEDCSGHVVHQTKKINSRRAHVPEFTETVISDQQNAKV